jgi:transposase InsO family protein
MEQRPLEHGDLVRLGELVGVTPKTLSSWRRRGGEEGRPGRPRHSASARAKARAKIAPVWATLPAGHDGWRTTCALLARQEVRVPTRLVQATVRELKRERRERVQARILAHREQVVVLARDAVWGQDETHLMRDEQGAVHALTVRETLVPRTLGLSIGPPAKGTDVVRLLEHTAKERGGYPLVLMADNGSINRNAHVERLLEREQVIVLWNLPHTPQHNARTERGIGDLKRASGLARAATRGADPSQVPVCTREPGVARTRTALRDSLAAAWLCLDVLTPRCALGGRTPYELDSQAPRADDLVCRARFYQELRLELERIALGPGNARARRMAQRDATWRALQRYGLVTRTRGGRLVPAFKPEGVSSSPQSRYSSGAENRASSALAGRSLSRGSRSQT